MLEGKKVRGPEDKKVGRWDDYRIRSCEGEKLRR